MHIHSQKNTRRRIHHVFHERRRIAYLCGNHRKVQFVRHRYTMLRCFARRRTLPGATDDDHCQGRAGAGAMDQVDTTSQKVDLSADYQRLPTRHPGLNCGYPIKVNKSEFRAAGQATAPGRKLTLELEPIRPCRLTFSSLAPSIWRGSCRCKDEQPNAGPVQRFAR